MNKRGYPNIEFWKIAVAVGNKVVLGYDAHDPSVLLRDDLADNCLAMMEKLNLKPIEFEEIKLQNENL